MKAIYYSIKEKVIETHNIDFGVILLFTIVTISFIFSFINFYY
jgi:hypothetical protein